MSNFGRPFSARNRETHMRFTKTLQQVLGSLRRRAGIGETKPAAPAAFELRYDGLLVGTLMGRDGKWTFWYSEEFRHRSDLRPFFLLRIPSMSQSDVQDALKHEHIDASDEAALLRRFGRRTIANPFELVDVDADDVPAPPGPSGPPRTPEPIAS